MNFILDGETADAIELHKSLTEVGDQEAKDFVMALEARLGAEER